MTDTRPGIDRQVLVSAYKKALLYAERKLRPFNGSGFISRITPEDVANDAISKTLSGKRPWDREKTPDLFVHLAGCISSEISNNYTSADYSQVERGASTEEIVLNTTDNEPSAENLVELESRVTFIIDYLASSKRELKQFAEIVLRNGINEPKEIAVRLNISVAEANSKKLALKRLMTHTDFLQHYISKNRPDLADLTAIVYATKEATADEEISLRLGIPIEKVRILKKELEKAEKDIYRGDI